MSLIFVSTAVDYYSAIQIAESSSVARKKRFMLLSVFVNLGLLGAFKYYGFFANEFNQLFAWMGLPPLSVLSFVLPVGISFYTFQTMSYTIDVYRGDTTPTRDLLNFALYVCFFPQLVAGPIERPGRLLPQIETPRTLISANFREGLYHVMTGLFKKVVVADNMAVIANTVFAEDPQKLSGVECLVGVYAFAFQIYGDFSGYSSIAKGVAKWLGFDIMENFHFPYFAIDPSDFWRRWHVSLSSWLRDYLYIPLGGSRGGSLFTYRNLFITMALGGLWHGAGWTFIAWGVFHGLLLCAYRVIQSRRDAPSLDPLSPAYWLRMVVFFHLVCFGWLLFRAESMTQVGYMLSSLALDFTITPFSISAIFLISFYCAPLLGYEFIKFIMYKQGPSVLTQWPIRSLGYSYCVLMLWFFPPPISHEFIYFQF